MDILIEIDTQGQDHPVNGVLVLDSSFGAKQWENVEAFIWNALRIYARDGFGGNSGMGEFKWWSHDPGLTSGASREFFFRMGAVHKGFWRVFAGGLLARGVVRLSLSEVGEIPESLNWQGLMRLPRIRCPHSGPFKVQLIENPNQYEDRTVHLAFKCPVDEDTFKQICDGILDWNGLLIGGFPPPDCLPADSISLGRIPYLADRYTIEHRIDYWGSDPEAFEVLVSLAGYFDRTFAALNELVVE